MDLLGTLLAWKYPALILFAIFEGPVTMTAVGFLLKLGYFQVIPALAAVLFGDLVGDLGWYTLGYYGAHRFVRRFGRFLSLDEGSIEKAIHLFRRHEERILFISKLTMGFGFAVATMFAAGMSRVSLKQFMLLNFFAGLAWTSFLLLLGYGFGNIYTQVSSGLRIASIIFFVVLLLGAMAGFRHYLKQRYWSKTPSV